MSIAGNVYGRVIIEKVRKATECGISEERCESMSGVGCLDQIFSVTGGSHVSERTRKLYLGLTAVETRCDKGGYRRTLEDSGVMEWEGAY